MKRSCLLKKSFKWKNQFPFSQKLSLDIIRPYNLLRSENISKNFYQRNAKTSPWTKFLSRDYSKETSLGVLLHRTQWRTQGRVLPPPPPILYFCLLLTFPLFGVNRKGHKFFSPDFASDRGRNGTQCKHSRRSKESFSSGSFHFSQ